MKDVVNHDSSKRNGILSFTVFFLLFFAILHGLPLTVDDNGFQQQHFTNNSQALAYVLSYGNGRVFGNGGIIFFTHHLLAADIIRAAVLSGITVLIPGILSLDMKRFMPVSMMLVLLISPKIFGQTYSWLSGFQNYVPPVFLFLAGIRLIQRAAEGSELLKACRTFSVFLCGVCMQLYIEHSTCINLLLTTILVCCIFKKEHLRPFKCTAMSFFLGCLIGTVLMFTVLIVFATPSGGETIGHTSYFSGGLRGLIYGIMRNGVLILGMYSGNVVALGTLAVILLIIIKKQNTNLPLKKEIVLVLGLLLPQVFFLFQALNGLSAWHGKLTVYESTLTVVTMTVFILFFSTGLRNAFLCTKSVFIKKATALAVCTIVSLIPLMFVWPIGERCLFHSYVFLIVSGMSLLGEITEKDYDRKKTHTMDVVVSVLLAAVVFSQAMLFADIRRMVAIRDSYLEERVQQGYDTASYFLIPSRYIYDSWNEETEHYRIIDGQQIRLNILPADVWFRMCYYHYT